MKTGCVLLSMKGEVEQDQNAQNAYDIPRDAALRG
jgi:hypothetical protein